ncbi:hypothetical protein ACWGS9_33235 [Bradyrhizobium sp. Arg314]
MNDYLDAYSIKARLAPAALAIAPVIVLIVLAFNWVQPSLPEAIIGAAVTVLFFAASNIARRLGKRKERQLFAATGGRPENRELNHLDKTLDDKTKKRYRQFLAKQLDQPAPTRDMEIEDPDEAAAFYVQCYNWLRENTRDTDKFRILFNENITYGYYRNLLALKPYGIGLNLLTIAAAAAIIYYKPDFAELTHGKLVALGILAAVHALYLLFGVTKRAVLDASKAYARQLTLSCETLIVQMQAG